MRLTRLTLSFVFVASMAVVACGGDDGGGVTTPDGPPPDTAPPALMGLGQKCGAGLPACPANATECFGIGGTNGNMYCSPKCLTAGTATGAAGNQLEMIQGQGNTSCMTSYTGTVGMGMCAVILKFDPMDNPIVVGKTYTGLELGCAIHCGAGACPSGLVPTTLGSRCLCIPQ
jgi:hypothetical protein